MKKQRFFNLVCYLSLLVSSTDLLGAESSEGDDQSTIEEVVVLGRFLSAAQMLQNEREDDEAVVDILDAESISRLGDSTVAAALRRVAGLTLANDKFVYIRGLGERYSATTLNGAAVPSPDLTRNVIPLDIFPAGIASGLVVQKTFSPDISANFAGGNVDIRTQAVPSENNFSIEIGLSGNSMTNSDVLSYHGGSDDDWGTDDGTRALPAGMLSALDQHRGDLGPAQLVKDLRSEGINATFADGELLNRELALLLNRDISIASGRPDQDYDWRLGGGAVWGFSDDIELGIQIDAAYGSKWRNKVSQDFEFGAPNNHFGTRNLSTRSIDLTGIATAGITYGSNHELAVTSLYLRNTDDEVGIRDYFNENRSFLDQAGFRTQTIRFEERELTTIQFTGTHRAGDEIKSLLPFGLAGWLPDDAELKWFYSDSNAKTDIPNQVNVESFTINDVGGVVENSFVAKNSSAADFRFTALDDDVRSYGYHASLPYSVGEGTLDIKVGYRHDQKVRLYQQREFGLGAITANNALLEQDLSIVFGDAAILDPDNGFSLSVQESATASYIAAIMNSSVYGMLDWRFNDMWRLTLGARYEDYKQVSLPWDLYAYGVNSPQVTVNVDELVSYSFTQDKVYPSLSIGYESDWLADTFQLRFGWSRTSVRPDLREVTAASYIEPITGELVFGRQDITPADVENLDLRGDWYFSSGDRFSLSLFSKEISNPIEFFEIPRSDTARAIGIFNVDRTSISGVELEGLLRLGFLGDWGNAWFLQGNVTMQDAETVVDNFEIAPTNNVRSAAGASDYIANLMLGFDSEDLKHTASLIYNVFGPRLYRAGRNGDPDEYQQPFHSLDFTYAWYPTEAMTAKLKIQNLLGEETQLKADDVTVFRQRVGTSFSVNLEYQF